MCTAGLHVRRKVGIDGMYVCTREVKPGFRSLNSGHGEVRVNRRKGWSITVFLLTDKRSRQESER